MTKAAPKLFFYFINRLSVATTHAVFISTCLVATLVFYIFRTGTLATFVTIFIIWLLVLKN
jgi:hypothetical protein